MNIGYGRKEREMHTKNIKQEVGYLDPHERIIGVGDKKYMVFQEGDDVPL